MCRFLFSSWALFLYSLNSSSRFSTLDIHSYCRANLCRSCYRLDSGRGKHEGRRSANFVLKIAHYQSSIQRKYSCVGYRLGGRGQDHNSILLKQGSEYFLNAGKL